ncbi:MAG: S9 family peptidase, partial [Bacteroidota bacterium]
MRKSPILLIICLLLSNLGHSQPLSKAPLNAELMWMLGRVSNPSLSPDGKTVVYGVRRFNIQDNKGFNSLYTIPLTGGTP